MTNAYVQAGKRTNVTLTGNATQGTVYDETARAGVYLESGVTGDLVPVCFEGRFTLAKGTDAITAGQKVYSDGTDVNTSAGGHVALGFAAAAAATGDSTVLVDVQAF